MPDIWFASDHHFNHANVLTFLDEKGELIRPGFKDIDHMNEYFIEKHNSVVKPGDKVYFGGDVGRRSAPLLRRMNGRKRLIMGNHDDLLNKEDLACFEKVLAWRFIGHLRRRFVISHFPLHPDSFIYRGMDRKGNERAHVEKEDFTFNVHGHLHEKKIEGPDSYLYLSICMEKLKDYTPMHIEEVLSELEYQSIFPPR